MYVSVFQSLEPIQSIAAFYGQNMPTAIQNPMQVPPSAVQGLRDTLYNTISEISSLKDEKGLAS